jgi:hypothetical protein
MAGDLSRWGNVFDRLYDPATYTGVYAERFRRLVSPVPFQISVGAAARGVLVAQQWGPR